MRLHALVTVLVTLSTLALPGLGSARGVRWYRGLDAQPLPGSPEEVARAYVEQRAGRLGLSRVELSDQARVLRWRDHRVVRFDQEFDGLPVFDRQIIVRIDAHGRVQTVTTNASADVDVTTRPVVAEAEALDIAAKAWGAPALAYARGTLGVQPIQRHGALIWRVDGAIGLKATRTWVDAVTGEVLHHFWRVWSAQGRVYEDNPVATPTLQVQTLAHLPQDATSLSGDWVTVHRYVRGAMNQQTPSLNDFTLEQTALADQNGDFLYTPTTDASQPDFHDPFAEVSAYYHANRVYSYFRDVHGYSSTKDHVALANYGENEETAYDNAFFSPVAPNVYLMAMGQGIHVDLAYDGDVIYHEFGHSVIDGIAQVTSQFEMFDEWGINTGPGGIHEGLADYWAGTITDDPMMGEYSLEGIQAGAGRNMSTRKVCPDDITGEVHMDGEVFGSAAWAARVALGDNPRMDDIMYGALAVQTSRPTFQDYAIGMQDAAQALVGAGDITQTQYDAMIAALADHGLLACGRDLSLDSSPQTNNIMFNFVSIAAFARMFGQNLTCQQLRTQSIQALGGLFPAIPFNFQFRKHVPAGATAVSLRIQHDQSEDLEFYVYARRAELVHFSTQSLYGMFNLVEPLEFDHQWGPFTSADQTIAINMTSDPALVPGETYYFAVTQKNCNETMGQATPTQVVLTAETDDTPYIPDGGVGQDATVSPDAGTDDGPKDKGCGCAAGAPADPAMPFGLLLLGLLVLGVIRRRR